MNTLSSWSFIIASGLLFTFSSTIPFSLKKTVNSFLSPQQEEQVHKEYTIEKNGTIAIENLSGSIEIKAAWKSNKVMLKATKKASAADLPTLTIAEQISPNKITLTTEQTKEKAGGSIDYVLIVPESITLNLVQDNGPITVKQVTGAIAASTHNGAIELHETQSTLDIITHHGAITIIEPQGNVQATTHNGAITITEATKSIIASTHSGSINVHCSSVPATAKIALTTHSGAINLQLPSEVNADVQAKTVNGRVISEHLITLKPITTKLNRTAWEQFKKEINGTLGTGEASIALNATNSTIKITEVIC